MNIKVVKNLPSELSIINVSGKIVLEKIFTNTSNLNLSSLKSWTYILFVKNHSQIIPIRDNLCK